jgi:3',5'-cyclic-AMP phosphodiesterase
VSIPPQPPRTAGPAARLDVFAVEERALQIAWACLPSTGMTIDVGGRLFEAGIAPPAWYQEPGGRRQTAGLAGPGAITVDGLEPATTYDVCLSGPAQPRTKVATATTLPPPPGRLLARFATISDCHIGEQSVGPLGRFHDPRPRPPGLAPYPVRCARAAIAEAEAWGADLLIAKGDLTREGEADEIYQAVDVLASASVPVEAILGNHDVRSPIDTAAVITACGLSVTREPRARDLPGIRLVLGHSPQPDYHRGAMNAPDAAHLARLAGEATTPVMVALHHPPRRWPVQTHYPPSIARRDSVRLVEGLAAANPSSLIVAGHTHRNRRYQVGGVTVAEVGSTKDYPGQWAGYSVYEGGIRQVIYRVAAPAAIAWTETTRRAMAGIWGWWSPGRLSDRCWTLNWPDRALAAGARRAA